MNTTRLRRSVIAVSLVLAGVVATSAPAGAAVHDASVDGGWLTLTKTGVTESIILGAVCTSTTLTADFGTETVGGSFGVTAFSQADQQSFSNGVFHVVLTRSTTGNSNGTWTSGSTTSSHTVSSARVAIIIEIYTVASTCVASTLLCSAAVILHINSTFPTSLASGNRFSATGGSVGHVVSFPTCGAGPSQIVGTTVSTSFPMTGEITT